MNEVPDSAISPWGSSWMVPRHASRDSCRVPSSRSSSHSSSVPDGWLDGALKVVVAVSGSVAGGAARFELVGDGVVCLVERWVVVEFEQIDGLTINAFMVVVFENDPFLAGCWLPSSFFEALIGRRWLSWIRARMNDWSRR